MRERQNYRVLLGDDSWSRMIRRVVNFLEKLQINRKYKDRLFVKLFQDKKNILALYNALNGTSYSDVDDIVITTIDDAVYMGMKNDCSFIIGSQLNLYEHQSTFCGNMPLRGLIYLTDVYQSYIVSSEEDIYGTSLIKLPAPRFIIFYNGTGVRPEKEMLRLSDAFDGDDSCLECKAVIYNVNYGHNEALMKQCKILEEYAYFIDCIRRFQREGYVLKEAVELATQECIEHNVLKEFLLKNRGEVTSMLLTEYDEKKHMKMVRRDAREEGESIGMLKGKAESILELLEEHGQPSEQLEREIKEQKELGILREWVKYAAHSDSIEDFENKIHHI